ncbi:MAG: hypothetical protein FWC89_08850 [Defluviitaleaceae bacterium]|nr:hypothetical protein [Defluviitaleaceae bacterium]
MFAVIPVIVVIALLVGIGIYIIATKVIESDRNRQLFFIGCYVVPHVVIIVLGIIIAIYPWEDVMFPLQPLFWFVMFFALPVVSIPTTLAVLGACIVYSVTHKKKKGSE